MKKITGFFMAILPFFVLVLLFISGYVIKSGTTVRVTAVSITQDDFAKQVTDLSKKSETQFQLDASVFPKNASNPTVFWTSANPEIIEVSKKTGDAIAKNYGETYIYAQSEDDSTKIDSVKIEIFDTKIHELNIVNQYNLSYIGLNQPTKIEVTTIPANHIIDKTLLFEVENNSILDVTADGWIIPKSEGTTKVTVKAKTDTSIVKSTDVTVGKGVSKIEFNDLATTITDSQIYNLRDEIVTYPETDKEIIKNEDFEYTFSDESVATVLPQTNTIIFKKQEPVVVTATYKRNSNLKISKTIYSTCNNLLSVNFDANEYETTLDVVQQGDKYVYNPKEIENLNINIYPNSNNLFKDLIVESSDTNVVQPEIDLSTGKWKFTALKPGTATLLASAKTTSPTEPYKFDACLVKVLSPTQGRREPDHAIINNTEVGLENGMFYYPLLNNLKLDVANKSTQKISFDFVGSTDIATIDENNILHFNKEGTVTIKVYLDGYSTSSTFNVTAKDNIKKITYDDITTTYKIEAGKRYCFVNATPIFESQPYENKFNVDENGFSAICGQDISQFKIKDNTGNEKNIRLIVSEKPLYINFDIDTYYPTSEVEINFKNLVNASVVPSTALKEDGSAYSLSYLYTPAYETVATIENNIITFKQAGMVDVAIKCDDLDKPAVFKVKSTFGGLDKFDVYDGLTKIPSNYTKKISANQSASFTISGLSSSEASQIEMEQVSATKLCSVEKQTTGLLTKTVTFTVTAPSDIYGIETFAIKTKTYSTYVNIDVTGKIQGFEVMFNNNLLKSGASEVNTTFTNSLELDVLPYPIIAMGEEYTVTDEMGSVVEHTNNKIKLTDLEASSNKELTFKWKIGESEKTQVYIIKYNNDISQLRITLSEADEDNAIYFGCNETTKSFHLSTNGLVPKDFFSSEKFKGELEKTTSAKVEIHHNLLTISGIANPDGKEFVDKLILSYDSTQVAEFGVGRDLVSKIVFPNHDNDDLTDKKGLQKVHVYGHLSHYDDIERTIDGYYMPIKIFNYKGNEVWNDPQAVEKHEKAKLISGLNINISDGSTVTYNEAKDSLFIKFGNNSIYTVDQIVNNEFDSKINKNVLVEASTKSKKAKASYTFVVTNGVNIYNLFGLSWIVGGKIIDPRTQNKNCTAVLQTNFGLEPGSKDNVPLDCPVGNILGIHGNGYTINSDWSANNPNPYWFGNSFAINVNLQGCFDSTYKKFKFNENITMKINEEYEKCYFAYSIYSNFLSGIVTPNNKPYKIKNSIFYNNKSNCLDIDRDSTECFVEDSIFIDSKGIPILLRRGASIYFKGRVDVYNFITKDDLKDVMGMDLKAIWPLVESAAKLKHMSEIGADGRLFVNSFMAVLLSNNTYFWNSKTKQYERGNEGTPDAANFTAKYVDVGIPLTSLSAALWATYNKEIFPNAFSYYDEFDNDGKIKPEFFSNQIKKVTRQITFF